MKHLILTSIFIITFPLNSTAQYPNAANNTLTEAEKDEGWELLFDGKTLEGWRGFGMDKVPVGWVLEDATIKIVPKICLPKQADGKLIRGADLITDETYKDFELVCDWKIVTGGNSGIKYNVFESHQPRRSALGFEYSIMDDSGLSDLAMQNSTGALYALVPPDRNKLIKPIGEFNTSRIIFNGNHGEHWLNGKKVLEYDLDSNTFDSALKKSKFSGISGFAEKRKAHIVLQYHGEAVWYRNIKIRRLNYSKEE